MGFGFNLGMIFIILPLTVILLLVWAFSGKSFFGKVLLLIWGGIIGLIILSFILRPFSQKIILEKEDYYGEYIIDRNYFKGIHADWQYNHFRFEITEKNEFHLHITENERTIRTIKGSIKTTNPKNHNSARLIVETKEPKYHLLNTNPTTYRDIWGFYLVFNSSKYNNMYFRKGKWESINK